MKKNKILILVNLTFISINLFSQISIDSINIFQNNSSSNLVDSVYIKSMAGDQLITNITYAPTNDVCGSVNVKIYYEGCGISQIITYPDTIIHLGFPTQRINIITVWDTSYNCSFPTTPVFTDTTTWENCSAVGVENHYLVEKYLAVFPNPSKNVLNMKFKGSLQILEIALYEITGKLLKTYNPTNRELNVKNLNSGKYVLKIKTDRGIINKKVIVENN